MCDARIEKTYANTGGALAEEERSEEENNWEERFTYCVSTKVTLNENAWSFTWYSFSNCAEHIKQGALVFSWKCLAEGSVVLCERECSLSSQTGLWSWWWKIAKGTCTYRKPTNMAKEKILCTVFFIGDRPQGENVRAANPFRKLVGWLASLLRCCDCRGIAGMLLCIFCDRFHLIT